MAGLSGEIFELSEAVKGSFDDSAVGAEPGNLHKVGTDLAYLFQEYQRTADQPGPVNTLGRNPFLKTADDRVIVDIVTSADPVETTQQLAGLGMEVTGSWRQVVSGWLPIDRIGDVAALDGIVAARPFLSQTFSGTAQTQGDAAQQSDLLRLDFGLDGTGVTIGVLSDSYNNLGGATANVAAGELPGFGNPNGRNVPVNVLRDLPAGGSDEGRAMLQLLHDVAPGAQLAFSSAGFGQAAFAQSISDLQTIAGANVIVDDVLYLAEPFFQDGIITQAVDSAVAAGVTYVTAAGNNASNSYESPFRTGTSYDSGAFASVAGAPSFAGGVAHDFDSGTGLDELQNFSLAAGKSLTISFQWDQPFASVTGGVGAATDMDVYVLNSSNQVVAASLDFNIGADAVEILHFRNTTGATQNYQLMLVKHSGPAPGLLKYVNINNGQESMANVEFATNSPSIYGHANSSNALTVGAAGWNATPAFGTTPPVAQASTSVGGNSIRFDSAGSLLQTPFQRNKPDVVAPDGGNTSFFGVDSAADADTLPNFSGSSASAAHAAGVAALFLHAYPDAQPAEIYNTLRTTTVDMAAAGFDPQTGYGLIDVLAGHNALLDITATVPLFLSPSQQISDTTPTLTWGKVPTASSYEMTVDRVDANGVLIQSAVLHETAVAGTSFTPLSALSIGYYQAAVRAKNSDALYSQWSSPQGFQIVSASVDGVPLLDAVTINGSETLSSTNVGQTILADGMIRVDVSKSYRLSGWARSGDDLGNNYSSTRKQYFGLKSFDIDQNTIESYHVGRFAGSTDTTLAATLVAGATQVVLTNATGWSNGGSGTSRALAWYGYTDSTGYTYPDFSYTRNVLYFGSAGAWAAGGISGNTITLSSPWAGPTLAAGTAIRNAAAGNGYVYAGLNDGSVPNAWTEYAGVISGVMQNGAYSDTKFRPGTAYIKPMFLINYQGTNTNQINWRDIEFTYANAEPFRAGDIVELHANTLEFGGGATYAWTQKSGPTIALNNVSTGTASFTAPAKLADYTLTFDLEVSDGTTTLVDTVTVHVAAEEDNESLLGDAKALLDSVTLNSSETLSTTNVGQTILADGMIPVDVNKFYRLSGWARSGDDQGNDYSSTRKQYFGLKSFDIDQNTIESYHVGKHPGSTDTTLAVTLVPGATQIVLANATGWSNGGSGASRALAWYGYTDCTGYTYPDYTYTRNVLYAGSAGAWAAGGISSNTITLSSPWAGPTLAAGTAVRNAAAGNGYVYAGLNDGSVPNAWTEYSGVISGVMQNGAYSDTKFRPGTAYVQPMFLVNYSGTGTNQINWRDVEFTHANAEPFQAGETVELHVNALDFSGSASYGWTQVSGPAVTLANATSSTASFSAPFQLQDYSLQFALQVRDGDITFEDTVTVPVAADKDYSTLLGEPRALLDAVTITSSETLRSTNVGQTILADGMIPVDVSKSYRLSGAARSGNDQGGSYSSSRKQYFGLKSFDIDQNTIESYHVGKFAGSTDTTLAVTLVPGATQVVLTNATGWSNGGSGASRALAWYGYTDSTGYTYPDYTYSRNVLYAGSAGAWAAGGISSNTITLSSPWAGPTLAAGTAVRNAAAGNGYVYAGLNDGSVPNAWTEYSGVISGVMQNGAYSDTKFRPGTAFVQPMFLINYQGSGTNEINWKDVEFTFVSPEPFQVGDQVELHVNTLDFPGSTTYAWTQTSGPAVAIEDASFPTASFVVPKSANGMLSFDVQVSDGEFTLVKTVVMNIATVAPQARVRLEAVDKTGTPITSANVGDEFLLNVYVQDLRASGQGLFSAYLDVEFDADLASIAGPLQYSANYGNVQTGGLNQAGLIDDAGATNGGFTPLGSDEFLLFSAVVRAEAAGELALTANPADLPGYEFTAWGLNTVVSPYFVEYGNATVTIAPAEPGWTTSTTDVTCSSLNMLVAPSTLFEGDVATVTLSAENENSCTVDIDIIGKDGSDDADTGSTEGYRVQGEGLTDTGGKVTLKNGIATFKIVAERSPLGNRRVLIQTLQSNSVIESEIQIFDGAAALFVQGRPDDDLSSTCTMCATQCVGADPQDGSVLIALDCGMPFMPVHQDLGTHGLNPIVWATLSRPADIGWPSTLDVQVTVNAPEGISLPAVEVTWQIDSSTVVDESTGTTMAGVREISFAIPVSLPDSYPTGSYRVTVEAGDAFGASSLPAWKAQSTLLVQNLVHDNPIAPGWTFPFLKRLVMDAPMIVQAAEGPISMQGVALFRGDGSASWYQGTQDVYETPAETLSALTTGSHENTSVYILTDRSGNQDLFYRGNSDTTLNGLHWKSIDANGNETVFAYELSGGSRRLIGVTDPWNRTTSYDYTAHTITDFAGRVTQFAYIAAAGENHATLTFTHPDPDGPTNPLASAQEIFVYDGANRVQSRTRQGNNPNLPMSISQTTTLHYQQLTYGQVEFGRLDYLERPDGSIWHLNYAQAEGLPESGTTVLIPTLNFSNKAEVREFSSSTSSDGDLFLKGPPQNASDEQLESYRLLGNPVTIQVDHRGRVVQTTDALGFVTTITRSDFETDAYGNPISDLGQIVDYITSDPDDAGPLGQAKTHYEYDDFGNLIRQDLPELGSADPLSLYFGRYLASQPQIAINELGHATEYRRDAAGNVKRITQWSPTDFDVNTWQNPASPYDVNADGFISPIDVLQLINELNAHGARDLSPLLTGDFIDVNGDAVLSPLDALLVINYINESGSTPVPMIPRESSTQLDYTYSHQRVGNTLPGGLVESETVYTGRDVDGDGLLDPLTTAYQYFDLGDTETDAALKKARYGLLERITFADGATHEFTYDRYGNIASATDELGRITTFVHDVLGRLTQLTAPDPDGPEMPDGTGKGRAPITHYAYDGFDNLVSVTMQNYNPLTQVTTTHTTCMFYDEMNRLEFVIEAHPDVSTTAASCVLTAAPADWPSAKQAFAGRPVTGYTYDYRGSVETVTNPRGYTTTYQYDKLDRLVTVLEPNPGASLATGFGEQLEAGTDRIITRFEYYAGGNLKSVTDALGNVTKYTYDAWNRLDSIEEPTLVTGTPITTYDYEPNATGWLLRVTDPLQRSSESQQDFLGRTISVTGPVLADGSRAVTSFEYYPDSALKSVTDPRQNQAVDAPKSTEYSYDIRARLAKVQQPSVDGQAPTTQYSYYADGRLHTVLNPLEQLTTFTRDDLGRTIQVTPPDPDGAGPQLSPEVFYEYDSMSNLLASTDALNHSTKYGYDYLFRLTTETDANLAVTTFTYDLMSNLTSLRDPETPAPAPEDPPEAGTRWTYDALNRVWQETNPLDETRTYQYDAVGNLRHKTDRNARVTTFGYNERYQLTSENWWDGGAISRTLSFGYDLAGQMDSASDPVASYSYQPDAMGRVTEVTQNLAALGQTVVFTQTFDAASNRETLSATVGGVADFANTYKYDALQRMESVTQQEQAVTGAAVVADKHITFAYDVASQLKFVHRYAAASDASNLVAGSAYSHDEAGRLTGLDHADAANAALAGYRWLFDKANRLTDFTNVLHTAESATYGYDDRGQLETADYSSQTDESYSYDDNGNRTNTGYSTDPNNRLASDGTYTYGYDDEGNRILRTKIATGEVTVYTWDHRNRLVKVEEKTSATGTVTKSVEYAYDVFDRRIAKTIDEDGASSGGARRDIFVYDGVHIALQFEDPDADGPQAPQLSHRYLHGPAIDMILADEQVTSASSSGEVLWPLTDHLGTVRDIVDSDGDVVNHLAYSSFGQVVSETNSAVDFLFGFTGREMDEETGLMAYRARYYDPHAGRFISEDPIGFAGGDANLSRYVGNGFTNATDPSGLITVFFHGYAGPSGSGRSSGSSGSSSGESSSSSPGGSSQSSASSEGSSGSSGCDSSKAGGSSDSGQGSGGSSKPAGSVVSSGSSSSHQEEDPMVKDRGRYPLYRGQWGSAGDVRHYAYNEVDKAVADIIETVGPPNEQKEPIVIAGHSWGGDSALTAARRLNSKGYTVNLLATLDPVTDTIPALVGSTPTTRRPPKVETQWNYYQKKNTPCGTSIPGADVNELWTLGGHRDIDDNVDLRNLIRDKAIELHDDWINRPKHP